MASRSISDVEAGMIHRSSKGVSTTNSAGSVPPTRKLSDCSKKRAMFVSSWRHCSPSRYWVVFACGSRSTTATALPRAAAIAAILLGAFEIVDTDAFWHATNGERILELRTVPRVDEYSHTAAGEPTTYYSWLAEVIAALLIRAGGFELLVLVKALACGLLVAVLTGAGRAP